MEPDPFDLARFVTAQDHDGTYAAALAEVRSGRKRTHWMWFVFPQLAGLGTSPQAVRYAISGLPEARAHLAHDVLGPRLLECCDALLALDEEDPAVVVGHPDDLKLRSAMTLFAAAAPDEPRFTAVLATFFAGHRDDRTLRLLAGQENRRS